MNGTFCSSTDYSKSKLIPPNLTTNNSQVSFRPAFYNCQSCLPDQISDTFSKQNAWYDDDYISEYGYKQGFNQQNGGNDNGDDAAGDDAAKDDVYAVDDANYYAKGDDTTVYYDDANNGDDGDDGNNKYVNTDDQVKYNYAAHDDDFYNFNDDGNRRRLRKLDTLDASHSLTAVESRKVRRRQTLFGCLFVFDSYSI